MSLYEGEAISWKCCCILPPPLFRPLLLLLLSPQLALPGGVMRVLHCVLCCTVLGSRRRELHVQGSLLPDLLLPTEEQPQEGSGGVKEYLSFKTDCWFQQNRLWVPGSPVLGSGRGVRG